MAEFIETATTIVLRYSGPDRVTALRDVAECAAKRGFDPEAVLLRMGLPTRAVKALLS